MSSDWWNAALYSINLCSTAGEAPPAPRLPGTRREGCGDNVPCGKPGDDGDAPGAPAGPQLPGGPGDSGRAERVGERALSSPGEAVLEPAGAVGEAVSEPGAAGEAISEPGAAGEAVSEPGAFGEEEGGGESAACVIRRVGDALGMRGGRAGRLSPEPDS